MQLNGGKKNKIGTEKVLPGTEKEEKRKVLVQTLKGLGFCLRKKILFFNNREFISIRIRIRPCFATGRTTGYLVTKCFEFVMVFHIMPRHVLL
jgi:hypothetical protein